MMRMSKALGSVFAMAAACVALSTATNALADGEFTATSTDKGTIEVKGNNHWHVNKDAPWKATSGAATFTKDKWQLSETSAKVTGLPSGDAKVKVYVCNGDQCKNAEVTVTVK